MSQFDSLSDTESIIELETPPMSEPGSVLASPQSYNGLSLPPTRSPSPLPVDPLPQHSRYFFNDIINDFMVSTDRRVYVIETTVLNAFDFCAHHPG